LNELDLSLAAPAERQMQPQGCRLAQIRLVLKFRLLDEQKLRHAELVLEKRHACVNVGHDDPDLKDILRQCGRHIFPPGHDGRCRASRL
jgi:hypothetical protein